jgi:hypothetical protein
MTVRTMLWRGLDEPHKSPGFEAGISFDTGGFVVLYQDYLERIG